MKNFFFLAFLLCSGAISAQSDLGTDTLIVRGNCDMCQKRIETAAFGKGVKSASWSAETLQLVVRYDARKTDVATIRSRVVASGHDTDGEKAPDTVYDRLPGCCRYDRAQE